MVQSRAHTCTLIATTMMLRNYASRNGFCVDTITESSVRSSAWSSVGLSWDFTVESINVQVNQEIRHAENKKQYLIDALQRHPEGVVIYDATRRMPSGCSTTMNQTIHSIVRTRLPMWQVARSCWRNLSSAAQRRRTRFRPLTASGMWRESKRPYDDVNRKWRRNNDEHQNTAAYPASPDRQRS